MRWYLVFLGTTTIPVEAAKIADARDVVLDNYRERGIILAPRELKIRRAKRSDAGWLRDMGAREIADALAG